MYHLAYIWPYTIRLLLFTTVMENSLGAYFSEGYMLWPWMGFRWGPSRHHLLWCTLHSFLDTGLRDTMSCLLWSKSSPILAIGLSKGDLTIYNHSTAKRIPILGRHSKRIVCGWWSKDGLLALGSEDKSLPINSAEGDTLRIINLRAEPSHVQFSGWRKYC